MLLNKQLASRVYVRRARIAYVSWSLNQELYNRFVKRFRGKCEVELFDLSDSRTLKSLKDGRTLQSFDVVIDDFSNHPAVKKEAVRDFYDSNISRSVLLVDQIADKDIEFKIQYKIFVNWNLPTQTKKRLLALPPSILNKLAVENPYFKNDLMKGMIAFDKQLTQKLFSRFTVQTIIELLIMDAEKIMAIHFSSTVQEKQDFINQNCWRHVSAIDLLKVFNAFAWQNPEVKDLDMAAMVLNVFQSIILKEEAVIKQNNQIEMIQIGIQLGKNSFDELLIHYPWLYFYFKDLVNRHQSSQILEIEQMQELLSVHHSYAHIYKDVIHLANQLSESFDMWQLWALVFERGYADEVIKQLLVHLMKRNLISEETKDQLFYFKTKGFKSLWQKSA